MTRILHTADVHLDSPLRSLALRHPELRDLVQTATRTAFTRIVDTALEKNVAALLIAGDLFDGKERSAATAAFLTGQLERLRAGEIKVFYVKGNHDAENPLTGQLELPENVHVFGSRGGKVELCENVWIHGVSFAGRHAEESLLPKFTAPVNDAVNIAMLHTSIGGAEGHDLYAPCSVGDLERAGFDYWALGHIHGQRIHSKKPWIVMPGTPQGRKIGEPGTKSCQLLTIGKSIEVEEVPTSVVEFVDVHIKVDGVEDDDTLRDLIKRHLIMLQKELVSDSGIARVTLSGATPHHWRILRDDDYWKETATNLCRETGRIWLDRMEFDLSDTKAPGKSAVDELAKIMASITAEPGFAEQCSRNFDDVLKGIPQQCRAALAPDEQTADKLKRRLADSGLERILARMKGMTN